ncbi:hypothetical protein GCM10022228_13570 [Halomonas cibimaris]|uniref:Transposase DDE domain-containing protein n=1 Tax=Halomonas cibimaris TaxID=657012 RepID=A0ABP7LR86_9GAMM
MNLVQYLSKGAETRVRVRIDAGFTGNPTLVAMEERDIKYLGRLRSNKALQTWRHRISSGRPTTPDQPPE